MTVFDRSQPPLGRTPCSQRNGDRYISGAVIASNTANLLMALLLSLFFLTLATTSRAAANDVDIARQVTSLFARFDQGRQPGVAVMIIRDGDIIYRRGFGYADLEKGEKIKTDTMFRLASVSKQFTTMVIMRLAEQEKLAYDDPITRYLPELREYETVTIRDLMVHRSGLPDYYNDSFYSSYDPASGLPDNASMLDVLIAQGGPDFAPGERYEYSNTGYEMLALIAERVSGKPFRELAANEVFDPAKMTTALVHDHTAPAIEHRAYGYDAADSGFVRNDTDPLNGITGSGGVYATLGDFAAWIAALNGGTLVKRTTLDEAFSRTRLNNGEYYDYGFGWRISNHRGHRQISHGGSWVGFRTAFVLFPDDALSIVVLGNRGDVDPSAYAEQIADLFLPQNGNDFSPAESMPAVIAHHKGIPSDDIWWTVTGKQMAWMHRNVQQIFPTAPVYRSGSVRPLVYQRNRAIDDFEVDTADGPMPFSWFLESEHSSALGVVVMHHGRVVFEQYPRMHDYEKPIYWSVSKVFAGMLVRLLEERGLVDVDLAIETYLPELKSSAFAGTSVRNLLDMASGLDCGDEYDDRQSCYYQYSMAIGDGFRDADAPDDPYTFLATLKAKRIAEQGTVFSYSGVDNFILAWLVEEITGFPFSDVFTKEAWRHIGAEGDGAFLAYRYGIALSHGGFLATLRDLARYGLLYTPSYRIVANNKIISDAHIDHLLNGGRGELLRNAGTPPTEVSGVKHNVYQWGRVDVNGNISQGGWGGQGLIVNPKLDVVVVFAAYTKDDNSELPLEPIMLEIINAVFQPETQAVSPVGQRPALKD